MGVDVEIRVVPAKNLSAEEIALLGYELGSAVGSDHFFVDTEGEYGRKHGPLVADANNHYGISGVQILKVRTLHRYYGPGYERGPWPILRAMIAFLKAHDCIVHYGSDSGDTMEIATDDWIATMDKHWASNGGRPYRDYFKSFRGKRGPTCKICGPPLTNCGGGGADDYWYCQGCGYKAITTGDGKEWPLIRNEEFFAVHSEVKAGRRESKSR